MEGVPAESTNPGKGAAGDSGRYGRSQFACLDRHIWDGLADQSPHRRRHERGGPVLKRAKAVLEDKFKIDHVTLQVEDEEIRAAEPVLRV